MKCLYCDNVFTPNGSKFCCKTHQRKWETDHAVCWHPEKSLAFYLEEDAYDFINANEDTLFATNLHPFLCGCGLFHLGHSIKENA
jgi:hypothetical protein